MKKFIIRLLSYRGRITAYYTRKKHLQFLKEEFKSYLWALNSYILMNKSSEKLISIGEASGYVDKTKAIINHKAHCDLIIKTRKELSDINLEMYKLRNHK